MPYITSDYRLELDHEIKAFIDKVNAINAAHPEQTKDGLLNYSFTKILNYTYPVNKYHALNEAVGMLECLKQEYYRKRVGPYEDLKEEDNGVVDAPWLDEAKEVLAQQKRAKKSGKKSKKEKLVKLDKDVSDKKPY